MSSTARCVAPGLPSLVLFYIIYGRAASGLFRNVERSNSSSLFTVQNTAPGRIISSLYLVDVQHLAVSTTRIVFYLLANVEHLGSTLNGECSSSLLWPFNKPSLSPLSSSSSQLMLIIPLNLQHRVIGQSRTTLRSFATVFQALALVCYPLLALFPSFVWPASARPKDASTIGSPSTLHRLLYVADRVPSSSVFHYLVILAHYSCRFLIQFHVAHSFPLNHSLL